MERRSSFKSAIAVGAYTILSACVGLDSVANPATSLAVDTTAWCVTQYHRTKENDGMIMAFRRPHSRETEFALSGLREIDPTAKYQVTGYQSYEPLPVKTMTGEALLNSLAEINDRPGSILIEYQKITWQYYGNK